MKRPYILIGLLWLFLYALPCAAKSWNNITPLKTTRAEVIKSLGEPKPLQGTGSEDFGYGNEIVFIKWTRPNCFGKKLLISEEATGLDALVYQIRVQAKHGFSLKYEQEVSDYLATIKEKDCVGPQGGSCGGFSNKLGFGYGRSDLGIISVEFFATLEDETIWRSQLKPCVAIEP